MPARQGQGPAALPRLMPVFNRDVPAGPNQLPRVPSPDETDEEEEEEEEMDEDFVVPACFVSVFTGFFVFLPERVEKFAFARMRTQSEARFC